MLLDNSGKNSMVPVESSAAEPETARRKSRGIWSLAETAASSSRNGSTSIVNSSYFPFLPVPSLTPYISNASSANLLLSLNRKYF